MSGTREFRLALLGYDRRQVDAVRDEMDAVIAQLRGRITALEAELDHVRQAKPITANQAFATVARETERILQAAQEAGARIVNEARQQAEAESARARDEHARIVGDGRRARDEVNREVHELITARSDLVRQLKAAVAAVERLTAQLDRTASADAPPGVSEPEPPGVSEPEPPRALTGTDEQTRTVAPGPWLRVITGDEHPGGRGVPPTRHRSVPRVRDDGPDPFATRRDELASLRVAVTDLLGSELAALRDRLRERIRGMPDTGGGAVRFDPAAIADIADAVSHHLRRAFELGAWSVTRTRDQRPAATDDVELLRRAVSDILRRRVGDPLLQVLADGDREDTPPWLVVEQIDGVIADESAAMVAEIADTALSRAWERGRLATWVNDHVGARRWIVDPRGHRADGGCRTNADAGAVPTGMPFPSGEQVPPRHDRCTCTTIAAPEESTP